MKALLRKFLCTALAAGVFTILPAHADTPAPAIRTEVSLAMAKSLDTAALDYARSHNLNLAIVIVDSSGRAVTASRMDGVHPDILDVARKKARAAGLIQQSTGDMEAWPADSRVALTSLDDTLIARGGVPIRYQGKVIGAIGASGAESKDDEAAVLAALKAVMPQ